MARVTSTQQALTGLLQNQSLRTQSESHSVLGLSGPAPAAHSLLHAHRFCHKAVCGCRLPCCAGSPGVITSLRMRNGGHLTTPSNVILEQSTTPQSRRRRFPDWHFATKYQDGNDDSPSPLGRWSCWDTGQHSANPGHPGKSGTGGNLLL